MVMKDKIEEVESDVIIGATNIAKVIGRSIPTLMSLIKLEDFPAYLVGGIWQIHKDDLDAWIMCKRQNVPYVRGYEGMGEVSTERQLEEPKEQKKGRKVK